jgi:hypothetical protein
VTQQTRNVGLDFSEKGVRFLIRDRDSKYSAPVDEVFRTEGMLRTTTRTRARVRTRPDAPAPRRGGSVFNRRRRTSIQAAPTCVGLRQVEATATLR